MFSLKEDLTEYYRLIAVLGAQLNLDASKAGEGGGVGGTEGLTLQRLFVWVLDPLKRLKLMATLVAAAAQLKVEGRSVYIHTVLTLEFVGPTASAIECISPTASAILLLVL